LRLGPSGLSASTTTNVVLPSWMDRATTRWPLGESCGRRRIGRAANSLVEMRAGAGGSANTGERLVPTTSAPKNSNLRIRTPWEQANTLEAKEKRLLDRQDRRPARLAGFEIAMRLGRVLEGVALLDFDLHLAALDHIEQLARGSLELRAIGDVIEQRRPGQEQRALLGEDSGREGIDGPRRIAEAHHQAARPQAIERLQEGVLPDRIVDDRKLLALGDPFNLGGEVLAGVDDRVIAAVGPGELGLLVRTDGADHGRSESFRPLADDQPHASGGGVDQDRLARLDPMDRPQQHMGGHALEHHRSGLLSADRIRESYQPVGIDQPLLGITADRAGIGNAVPDL